MKISPRSVLPRHAGHAPPASNLRERCPEPLRRKGLRFRAGLALAIVAASGLAAAPGDPDDALTYFGSRPIYNNGAKVNVIVDDFGWLDAYRVDGIEGQLSATMEEWEANGIKYAAYFALGAVESDEAKAAMGDAGRVMDLDGTPGGYFMWTRQVFVDYMIAAGKTAMDLGAVYFLIDNGAPGLPTLSFDSEIVESFRQYLEANYTTGELAAMGVDDIANFNYRDYLRSAAGGSYTDSASVESSPPNDALWEAWMDNLEAEERAFFVHWTTTLKAYAQANYARDIYLSANRGHTKAWATADVFDFTMSETFLDSLGYPHHNLDDHFKTSLSLGKRFWSWNFPANTGSLNGSNDPYGHLKITQLSKIFAAEVFAAGGLYQIPIDWISYTRDDERLNTLLGATLRFPRLRPELFNLERAGEVAVVYNEAYAIEDASAYATNFSGIMALLGDLHRSYDVVVAAAPGRRAGSDDPLLTSDLSRYKAVVLSKTRYLSDEQVTALSDYVSAGGTVIGLGQVADRDETGSDVSGSRSFDDHFGSDGTSVVGSGRVIALASELGATYHGDLAVADEPTLAGYRSTWTGAVDAYVDYDFTSGLSRMVRTHRYADSDGSLVYHLVNRDIDMPSDVTAQVINGAGSASATARIPDGFSSGAVKVSWMSVESPTAVELAFTESGGVLSFTLPAFEHWGVLKVGSAAAGPQSIDETPEANIDLFTAAGGHRPDKLDAEGDLEFPYWYWKGGNHEAAPWAVPFLASDDMGLATVKLYYRYSSDNANWGAWSLHSSQAVSGENATGSFTFEGPDGEGYYQFRVQAVDTNAQEEVVIARDEAGYGFDETAPGTPSNAAADGFESGAWAEDLTGFTVTWDLPLDSLSGLSAAHIMLTTPSSTLDEESISATTQSWTPDVSGLVPDERHAVQYRVEDAAGNWSSYTELFSFRYGTLPVQDLENVAVAEGDGKLTVTWTNPNDANYSHAAFSYRISGDAGASSQPAGLSPDSAATSYDITGLSNGVAYEVRVNSVSTGGQDGNVIDVPGSYTPQEGAGGGGEPATVAPPTNLALEDNTANVRLTWVDNADNETGYAIERRAQGAVEWTLVASIGENAQAFVDNINIGTETYEYRVKATGASEDSDYSSIESISRSGGGGGGEEQPPAVPTGVSAEDQGDRVRVSWTDASSDETGFNVVRRVQGTGTWFQAGVAPANATSFEDMIDIGSQTYEYRVAAEKGQIASPFSEIAAVNRQVQGAEIGLVAIATGVSSVSLQANALDTVHELRGAVATELGADVGGVRLFRGQTELQDGAATLESVGFADGEQFTVLIGADAGSYAFWQLGRFGDATSGRLSDEDFSGDGVKNFLCYALGIDASMPYAGVGMARIRFADGAWQVECWRNAAASEAEVTAWVSVDQGETWAAMETLGFVSSVAGDPQTGLERLLWTADELEEQHLLVELQVERK